MINSSNCSYLEFNNIWHRMKGYEAHCRRLNQIRSSNYQNKKYKDMIEQIVEHQNNCNKKKQELKLQAIKQDNDHLIKRLENVQAKMPSHQIQQIKLHQGAKQLRQQMNERSILSENKKLKYRIESIQPHFRFQNFENDYSRHTHYLGHMQRFQYDQDNKVQLKALKNIHNYENKIKNRYKNMNHNKTHSDPQVIKVEFSKSLFQTQIISDKRNFASSFSTRQDPPSRISLDTSHRLNQSLFENLQIFKEKSHFKDLEMPFIKNNKNKSQLSQTQKKLSNFLNEKDKLSTTRNGSQNQSFNLSKSVDSKRIYFSPK